MTSPNWGPHMGFIRLALTDPEQRKLIAARDRRPDRARSSTRDYPGRRVPAVRRAASSRACSPTATSRRWWSRCAATSSSELDEQARAVAEVARTVPGVRDIRSSLEIDYPEVRVDDRSRRGGPGRRHARARIGADDARGDARQHQHAERVDRRRQRPVVLRRHLLRRTRRSPIPTRSRAAAGARLRRRASRSRSAPTATSAARSGPIAIERNQLQRAAHVLDADRGARHRQRRAPSSRRR